jgi:hypothetical protein
VHRVETSRVVAGGPARSAPPVRPIFGALVGSRVSKLHDMLPEVPIFERVAQRISLEPAPLHGTSAAMPILVGSGRVVLAAVGALMAALPRRSRTLCGFEAAPPLGPRDDWEAKLILFEKLPRVSLDLTRFLLSSEQADGVDLPQRFAMEVFRRALGDPSCLQAVVANFLSGVRVNADLRVVDPLFAAALELLDIVDHVGGRPGALAEFCKTYPAENPDSIGQAFAGFLRKKRLKLEMLRQQILDACCGNEVANCWLASIGDTDRRMP